MMLRRSSCPLCERPSTCLAVVLVLSMTLGCSRLGLRRPPVVEGDDTLQHLRFPVQIPKGEDLDIMVIREGSDIRVANRTPRSFQQHLLWLNQEYVAQIELIKIGTDNVGELSRFKNRHGESYPAGTFLAPDKSRRLVTADLINPTTGRRHRLVVRLDDN